MRGCAQDPGRADVVGTHQHLVGEEPDDRSVDPMCCCFAALVRRAWPPPPARRRRPRPAARGLLHAYPTPRRAGSVHVVEGPHGASLAGPWRGRRQPRAGSWHRRAGIRLERAGGVSGGLPPRCRPPRRARRRPGGRRPSPCRGQADPSERVRPPPSPWRRRRRPGGGGSAGAGSRPRSGVGGARTPGLRHQEGVRRHAVGALQHQSTRAGHEIVDCVLVTPVSADTSANRRCWSSAGRCPTAVAAGWSRETAGRSPARLGRSPSASVGTTRGRPGAQRGWRRSEAARRSSNPAPRRSRRRSRGPRGVGGRTAERPRHTSR